MRQAVIIAPGNLQYRDAEAPGAPGENEVLLRIAKIGICGSDIHVYHGEHPAVQYPVVQGHEYAARVEAVGSGVDHLKKGMRVTARPQLVCGRCAPCRRGQYNICENLRVEGFQAPGVAQDTFIVTADRVVPFPETISMDHGAMIEPVSVAVHATGRVASVRGRNVVVSGAGTIGNLVAQYAMKRGAAKVLITDLSDYRLQVAKACGITGTCNVGTRSFDQLAREFFDGEGFQVGFEAAGAQGSLDLLMKNVEKGGEIAIIGVYARNPVVNMYYLGEHELRLTGTLMYKHEDYLEAVDAIADGTVMLDPLISAHFSFEQFGDAYHYIEEKKDQIMKVIVDM